MELGVINIYWLLIISILAASMNSVVLSKAKANGKSEIFKFNLIISVVWLIILFTFNKGHVYLDGQVLFWGIAYGITQTLFILFKTAAMSTGPVSITTLIGNSSLIVSIIVSLMVWKEQINITDIIGLVLLIVAIFMCTYRKDDTNSSPKWKYYTALFLVCASGVGIVFKGFGKTAGTEHCGDMMLVASAVMVVCNFVICMFTGGIRIKNTTCGSIKKFLIFALISGVLSCIYNRLNVFLSGNLDAIIFFPSFNGGTILVSTLLSVLLCSEKLVIKQAVGLLLGISAICLIGIL